MKFTFKTWFIGKYFYLSAKPYLRHKNVSSAALKNLKKEYKEIVLRSKSVSQNNLVSSYLMGIFFIAMNRSTGLSAEGNYKVIAKAVSASRLFKKGLGTAEDYVSEKKFQKRKKWAEESCRLTNENNWVVDVLPKCADFDYGMDYHE